jgi:hypothetical protein
MLSVERGACHSIFVYDIAFAIDLNHAERLITSAIRDSIRHKRRAPQYFEYTPAPLRITQGIEPVQIESFATEPQVQLVVYDFGAVSVFFLPYTTSWRCRMEVLEWIIILLFVISIILPFLSQRAY